MSMFATLTHINTFKKVSYYSVCIEGDDKSIFEQFIATYSEVSPDNLKLILTNIRNIGDKRGAKLRYFRHEKDAQALPLKTKFLDCEPGNLRLYCSILSEDVVVLFSGGIKTTKKAQECDNVRPHFQMANKLSKQLTENITNKNLILNAEFEHRLEIGEDFELII